MAAISVALAGCCKPRKKTTDEEMKPIPVPTATPAPVQTGRHVHFSKVPLEVDMPPGWRQSQNTASWLVYRPASGGALVAMSGEKSCGVVEQRLYGALIELGLTNVAWEGGRKDTYINGLKATVAQGTAFEQNQVSYLKYALTHAPGGQGCLITLYNVWKSKGEYREEADRIIMSVSKQQ
jgi:hypothetical protein